MWPALSWHLGLCSQHLPWGGALTSLTSRTATRSSLEARTVTHLPSIMMNTELGTLDTAILAGETNGSSVR